MQKFMLFSFMVFPERFEPGNLTESTKQKYISNFDGLKPIQDLTMMNFDDLETISGQKLFQVFSVEKNNNFSLSKIFQIFLGHASSLKTSKIEFYCNPSTELAARLPYVAEGNLRKMKLFLTYMGRFAKVGYKNLKGFVRKCY